MQCHVEARSIIHPHAHGVAPAALDVHATAALERLTRWAAKALRAPVVFVSLTDADGCAAAARAARPNHP